MSVVFEALIGNLAFNFGQWDEFLLARMKFHHVIYIRNLVDE